jgi:WD40 repeat protein
MMRKTAIIISLLILFTFFFISMNYALSEGQSMKQRRPNSLRNISFIPQQALIAGAWSSGTNGSVRFWSINDGKLKEVLDLGKGEWADALAVSNNGSLIAIALLHKNAIACYSLPDKKWLWEVNWVGKGVVDNALRFAPDDRTVVVVGFRNIVTYDAQTGDVIKRQEDSKGFSAEFPNYRTRNNAISPSARYAAFWQGNLEHDEGWWSSRNIWVVVRDIENEKIIAKQEKIQEKYKNCAAVLTPDEKNLLLGSMDGYVRVWSIAEQKVIREWKAHWRDTKSSFRENPAPDAIHSLTFSPEGRYLATMGGNLFAIKIWDYETKKLIHEFDDVISSSLAMCSGYPMTFSPDGKFFAFEQQGQLCLYDTKTWEERWCVYSWPEDKRVN